MNTKAQNKILAVLILIVLLLTHLSTTIYAVSDEIENLEETLTYSYTINYYYDEVLNEDETISGKAEEGTIISYEEKLLDGYELDEENTLATEITISSNEDENILNIYYVSSKTNEEDTADDAQEETGAEEEEVVEEESTTSTEAQISLLSVDDGIAVISSSSGYITDASTGETVKLGVIDGSKELTWQEMHYAIYDGETYIVFCIQRDIVSPDGSSYTIGSDVKAVLNDSDYKHIAEMIFFGYTSIYGTGLPTTTAAWRAACACQEYIWNYVNKYIDSSYPAHDDDMWDSTYMSSEILAEWTEDTLEAYEAYHTSPSFDGNSYKIEIGDSLTLTDSNKVLQYYPTFSKTKNNVTFSHTKGSNTLTITVSSSCTTETVSFDSADYSIYAGLSNGTAYDADTMSTYLYFKSSDFQDLLFSNYLDPESFEITIKPYGNNITIEKVDTVENIISGAKVGVYSNSSCTSLVESGTTSSKGTITFDWLEAGTYYVKEISAPEGYIVNTTVYKVTVSGGETETVTIIDEEPTGEITVTKENLNGDTVEGAVFTVTAAEKITNYAGTTTYYKSGATVATLTTGSDGTATVSDLPLGKYTITETSVPEGYLLNTTSKTITLSYVDDTTEVIYGSATIVDEEPTGEITLTKTDIETGNTSRVIDDEVFHGDATLSGAVYTLYALNDITNVAGTVTYYSADEEIATFTFDEEGHATAQITTSNSTITSSNTSNTLVSLSTSDDTVEGLPLGSYYVKETTVPTGYTQDENIYYITLTYEDQDTDIITQDETVQELVQKATFEVIKTTTNQTEIVQTVEGVEFTAILTTYVEYYGSFDEALNHLEEFADDEYSVFTTGSDGHGISGYLAYGEYTVKETNCPYNDIEPLTETFTVTIDEDSAEPIQEFVINNEPFQSYIKLIKYDEDSGEVVTYSNATFKLYMLDEDTEEWEEVSCKLGKTTYTEWTTDENGIAYTETKLDSGTYKVEEIIIPDGFLELDEEITFEVNRDNDTLYYDEDYDAYITVSVVNEQPKGELIINKTVNLEETADVSLVNIDYTGIEFTLWAAETIIDYTDGEVIYNEGDVVGVYNLSSDGTLDVTDLWMGSYILQETATLDGLVVDDTIYDVIFTKEDDTTKVYTVTLDIANETTVLSFNKTDVDDNTLDGTILTLYDSQGNTIATWTVGEDEFVVEGLNVGETYILKETYTLDTYVTAKDVEFTVENTEDTAYITMVDKRYSIAKVNVAGEEVEGAELTVYDQDGNIVDSWVSTDEVHYISGLKEGETYTLVETITTDGYVTTTDIEFTVSEEKVNEHLDVVDKEVISTKTDVDGNILTGTGLAVYDTDGNLIDSWTVGEQIIELTEEEQSELEENGTLSGTTSIEVDITVTLTSEDNKLSSSVLDTLLETIEVSSDEEIEDTTDTESTDETQTQDEETTDEEETETTDETTSEDETTEDAEDTETETTEETSATTYEINYTITKVTDADYYRLKIEFNGNISYYYINLDGTESYHMVSGLVEGNTYILKETYTLDTYVTAKDVEFTVTEDKDIQDIIMVDKRYSVAKVDISGEEVVGAKLTVYDQDGNIVDEWISTEDVHYITGLTEGETYTLVETVTADGYVTTTDIEFTVSEEKLNEHLDVIDKQVTVSKIGSDDSKVIGAELAVYDTDGNIVDTWITDGKEHAISGLVEGQAYVLVELSAPDGYYVADNISFEVTEDKETQVITMIDTVAEVESITSLPKTGK